jgi:hypothetical protein
MRGKCVIEDEMKQTSGTSRGNRKFVDRDFADGGRVPKASQKGMKWVAPMFKLDVFGEIFD